MRTTDFYNFSTTKHQAININRRKHYLDDNQIAEFYRRGFGDERLRVDVKIGVEDLFCILPEWINHNEIGYSLDLYKSAFDVPVVAYRNPQDHTDVLHYTCADDTAIKEDLYCGSLVDALFNMLIYIDDNHFEVFEEFKWHVKRQLNIHYMVPMNDYHYIQFEFTKATTGERMLAVFEIEEFDDWTNLLNRKSDEDCVKWIKDTFGIHIKNMIDVKFISLFTGDEHVEIGAGSII